MSISKPIINQCLYEGCGNMFLIAEVKSFDKRDGQFRNYLKEQGIKYGVDSVMVLYRDPRDLMKNGYHISMDVFEPRGVDPVNPDLAGSWSTMCGNGVRAVTRYLLDSKRLNCLVNTGSGIREVNILPDNQYRVCMGEFATDCKTLGKYVINHDFKRLFNSNQLCGKCFVGLNGDSDANGNIDGEPHLVAFLNCYGKSLKNLIAVTNEVAPQIISRKDYFPYDINFNLVSIIKKTKLNIELNACTYERGVEYITQSCGTGATVVGSQLLRKNKNLRIVKVNMPGGSLVIERERNKYFLTGSAKRVCSSVY